jgi:hypothetical protein
VSTRDEELVACAEMASECDNMTVLKWLFCFASGVQMEEFVWMALKGTQVKGLLAAVEAGFNLSAMTAKVAGQVGSRVAARAT